MLAGIRSRRPSWPPPSRGRRTRSWPGGTSHPLGGRVVQVADDAGLPFPEESFDLVVSRHPVGRVAGGRPRASARRNLLSQ